MATGIDFERLLAELRERPEHLAALRELLTSDALSAVTASLDRLAEAQARTEERLAALTARVDALAERMDALAEAQAHTEEALQELARVVAGMRPRLDRALGELVEIRYGRRLPYYLGRTFRGVRLLEARDLDEVLDPLVASETLSEDQAQEIRLADAVLHGRRRADDSPVYVVVEASAGVGETDVRRASDRAELLSRSGTASIGLVAGEVASPDVGQLARELHVWQVTDGVVVPPAA